MERENIIMHLAEKEQITSMLETTTVLAHY
jgi:hypothetical protein